MRNRNILLLLSFIFLSCQEDLEFMHRSFIKVYGFDRPSAVMDMIETRNGDLVIVGSFNKTPHPSGYEPIEGPFILRTDANGNQKQFRNFYFTGGTLTERALEFKEQFGLSELGDEFIMDFDGPPIAFKYVRELNNGNFFVVGFASGNLGGVVSNVFHFFMILNPEFEPILFRFFSNSRQELETMPGGRYIEWRGPKPIVMENGEILLLATAIFEDYFTFIEGFSIYRITEEGEFAEIWDYTADQTGTNLIDSWVLDQQGNVIVYGMFIDNKDPQALAEEEAKADQDVILFKINISTGEEIKRARLFKGNANFTYNCGIQRSSNGFALSDYHIDTVGESNLDPDNDGYRNFFGGLWFVDDNLDSLGKVHLTDSDVHWSQGELTKTRDGGFLAAYERRSSFGNDLMIIRTDPEGNVLWKHIMDNPLSGGLRTIMVETQDGGIAIAGHRDYNSMGIRITLIKLTQDGKL